MDAWKGFLPEHADANKLGVLINMLSIGSITSYCFSPWLADTLGRKPTIMLGCVVMIAGSCIGAFCTGYHMYIGGRFVLGFGNSLVQVCCPMLLMEICHPQHRARLTAAYNCLWNAGSVLVSVLGWGAASIPGDWSWRSITLLQAVLSLVQLVGVWWVPESPRFLVSRGEPDRALAMLAKHHGGGDAGNATVALEHREIKATIASDRAAAGSASYLDFFKTQGNRWRLMIIVSLGVISQYSGNALFSNYIDIIYENAGIREQGKKLALSAAKNGLDLFVSVSAAMSVDRVGRRPLFLASMAGMVVSFACWTVVEAVYEGSAVRQDGAVVYYANQSAGYAQIALVWLFSIFYDIAFAGLLIAYALEILPYHLRAKGIVVLNMTVQGALAIGNQTNKLAWTNMPNVWNFLLFYTLWNTCELVFVYFVYVETRGPTLEEVARIFDGDDAVPAVGAEQATSARHDASGRDSGSMSEAKAA
ncbi:hypothetical protein HIM_06908 [Hirsutella minnesotensis 3608]|uniref:Major facilitator superfamily (MFS) profile domain-containing protein n=1 Tax=Hirsutella minnesotensis 3608 TaxID=1043627 RepID=A0A0F7ZNI1_9HYPO|nr:hypothetical protein HIM_06908 [Hirsutella minnesotensis 3608]